MTDKQAFYKHMVSMMRSIAIPIAERKVHTVLDAEVFALMAKLGEQMNQVNSDPTNMEWKVTIASLEGTLRPGGVCTDETIRVEVLKELKIVKEHFKEATAKPEAAPSQPQAPKASL